MKRILFRTLFKGMLLCNGIIYIKITDISKTDLFNIGFFILGLLLIYIYVFIDELDN